jgi:predicted HD superfamily hydrolase involved in NAD metabolism
VTTLPAAIEDRLRELPAGLRDHIQRAREVGQELAQRHGVDVSLADQGIAAHDLARALKSEALLKEARRYRRRVGAIERSEPLLLHGAVAALWLQRQDGIEDEQILEAVRWHTTGRKGMGLVAKVVFLADKLDPRKV